MKDFLGNDVEVGDEVITLLKGYRSLNFATVISIAPKTIQVEYKVLDGIFDRKYRVDSSQFIVHKKCGESK